MAERLLHRRRSVAGTVFAAALLLSTACVQHGSPTTSGVPTAAAPAAGGSSNGSDGAIPGVSSPAVHNAVHEGAYEWKQLPIGAGGFVTGIVSSLGGGSTMYARTDVGGAYRWDGVAASWVQMITATSVPEPVADNGDYNVDSIAVSASDGKRVVLSVGNDYNPGADNQFARGGRVLVSDDGGRDWRSSEQRWFISGNQGYRNGTERLAVDPDDPDHVLFGTSREGAWQTVDGGGTWQHIPIAAVPVGASDDPSADQPGVSTVGFIGGLMVVGVANSGIYTSADRGRTWQRIRALGRGEYPEGAVAAGGRLWVALQSSVSTPGHVASWDRVTGSWTDLDMPNGSPFFVFAVDPANPAHVVLTDDAVRDGHMWTSHDGGSSWSSHDVSISSPEIPWLQETDLDGYMSTGRFMFDLSGNGTLWFAEGFAVWRTDDVDSEEVNWVSSARGIEVTVTSTMVVATDGTPVAATADSQGFRFSDPDAYPRKTLIDRTFVGGTSIDASGRHPDVLAWVGAEYQIYYDGNRRARGAISTDGGKSWAPFDSSDKTMFGGEVAVSATDPSVLVWLPTHFADPFEYLRKPVGVYSSRDGGRTWQHLESVDGADSFHRLLWWFTRRALAADRVNGNFYLMSDENRFFVSTDNAVSWNQAVNSPPCKQNNACHVYGEVQAQPGVARRLWASVGSDGLYRSDDAGTTPWRRLPGIDEARAFAFGAPLAPDEPLAVYVYGRANGELELGLWRSTDDGATWSRVSTFPGEVHATVTSVTGDPHVPGRIYVGFAGVGYVLGDLGAP